MCGSRGCRRVPAAVPSVVAVAGGTSLVVGDDAVSEEAFAAGKTVMRIGWGSGSGDAAAAVGLEGRVDEMMTEQTVVSPEHVTAGKGRTCALSLEVFSVASRGCEEALRPRT